MNNAGYCLLHAQSDITEFSHSSLRINIITLADFRFLLSHYTVNEQTFRKAKN